MYAQVKYSPIKPIEYFRKTRTLEIIKSKAGRKEAN